MVSRISVARFSLRAIRAWPRAGCRLAVQDAVRAELADCGGDESVAKTNLTERAFSKKRGGPGEPKPKHLAPGFFRGRGRDDSMTRVEIEGA